MATTSKATAGTAGSKPEPGSIESDLAELREQVAELTKQLAAVGEKSVSTARRAASEGVEQLRSQGEAKLSELRDTANDFEARVTETVREKPVTSLAIAAGIGFLFAMIARR